MVGHCKDTLRLALQGYSAVGYSKDTWWLGTAGILGSSHCRDALRLGFAGILCGGALHEYSRQRARTTLTLKSNNPTVRVGKKPEHRPNNIINLSNCWKGFAQA